MGRLALAVLLLLSGCQAPGGDGQRLDVFAAASLTETFTRLGSDFEARNDGVRVVFNFAGSSTLARQINAGAPADVFASADPATMKLVTDAGNATDPAVFARNELVIAVAKGNPHAVAGLADLARPELKVALCARQVPCGAAASRALAAAGVTVTPVTLEQGVKAALTKVRLGEVDAALVYRTDVGSAPDVDGVEFPESVAAVNDYQIAVCLHGGDTARAFVAFVRSEHGREVLAEAGFG